MMQMTNINKRKYGEKSLKILEHFKMLFYLVKILYKQVTHFRIKYMKIV